MKKFNTYSLMIGLIVASSCMKNEIESPEIIITLLDDVTPMIVRFEVEDKWNGYQWMHNDTLMSGNAPSNIELMTYFSSGNSKVELTVYGNSKPITVTKEFILPSKSSIIEIFGFTPNHDILQQASNDSILYFDFFYAGIDTVTGHRVLSHGKSGSIYYFDQPIYFDYTEFLSDPPLEASGAFFDFKVLNQKKDIVLFSMHTYNTDRQSINDRNLNDGGLKEIQLTFTGDDDITLNIDFKP
jgi:hypothetical protein